MTLKMKIIFHQNMFLIYYQFIKVLDMFEGICLSFHKLRIEKVSYSKYFVHFLSKNLTEVSFQGYNVHHDEMTYFSNIDLFEWLNNSYCDNLFHIISIDFLSCIRTYFHRTKNY